MISVEEIAEVSINVVPVTKEDGEVHKYGIPSGDCFTHLEVQFRFFKLSSEVEVILSRTYCTGYENPAKRWVEMPVVGGEDKYQTRPSSRQTARCGYSLLQQTTRWWRMI